MKQHAGLSVERWRAFPLDSRILMIANEMNRARSGYRRGDIPGVKLCYERALNLVDLTVSCGLREGLCEELLRWRDLLAGLYIDPDPSLTAHDRIFIVLLRMTPVTSQQIPCLFPAGLQSRD